MTKLIDITNELSDAIEKTLQNKVNVSGVNYPVFVSSPQYGENYVLANNIMHSLDNTKDNFRYSGSFQIVVAVNDRHQADRKLGGDIRNKVRGLLKDSLTSVLEMKNLNMVLFNLSSARDYTDDDKGRKKIHFIDIFNFLIT